MRKLTWFSLGFAAACAMCVWLMPVRFLLPVVLIFAAAGVAAWKFRFYKPLIFLAGCCVGIVWYGAFHGYYLSPALGADGRNIQITATATDYSYDTDYGVAVDGKFLLDGRNYRVRMYLDTENPIAPGDTITGTFHLRYTAPGGMRDATYHAGDGILFLGYQRGEAQIVSETEENYQFLGAKLNRQICELLARLFPEDLTPFVQALMLGEDHALDYETDTALKLSGIRHIIAVSGLHVAILFTMLRTISLNRPFLTAVVAFPTLILFCAVAGFTPSVTRACLMVGLMLLGRLMNREYDSPTALAFASLAMLIRNPLVMTSVSFQLSVSCVAGILLFQEPIAKWIQEKLGSPSGKSLRGRATRWFASSVSMSLSATLLTMPMSAFYFGSISLVGVITNLLCLWAVGFAFYGIVALCLLSLMWIDGAAFLAGLVALPVRYVIWVAKLLSSFPLASLYTKSTYIILWIVFLYLLLAVFMFARDRKPMVLGCCATVGLCLALLLSWTEYRIGEVHLTALDVGQGQCLILHHEGKTFLVDCGGSDEETAANTAAETLLSRGITRLDGIILTHGDKDHAGGIPYLLSRMDTGFLMIPSTTDPETVAGLTENWNGKLILADRDYEIPLDRACLTVFGPTFAAESNENSLCVLFEGENCAILVTGDRGSLGEMLLMHEAALPDVDLLIAGHHGSKYSTTQELLNTVQPETVFISVGAGNAYGHPAGELLDRLSTFGCEVYRTDLNGTLIFRR